MTAQEHILKKLESLKEPYPEMEIKGSLEDAVYARLMSKKFRKVKAEQVCVDIVRKAVADAVKNNKPLFITECFGGNKLWRFEEAPEIDWAELFSLIYFLDWMKYVVAVHKPGVIFDYYSQDLPVQYLDNLPQKDMDAYSDGFRKMLEWIKSYIPEGVTVQYRRHREMVDNDQQYLDELREQMDKHLEENNGKLPELDEKMKAATELNVRLNEGQDDDPLWREKVEHQHQAIFSTPSFLKYAEQPNMIWTCPTYYEDSIVTGSTKKSFAKFWAAVGALEEKESGYNDIVLTPSQLEKVKFEWQDIAIPGLEGKNFSRIRVVKKTAGIT